MKLPELPPPDDSPHYSFSGEGQEPIEPVYPEAGPAYPQAGIGMIIAGLTRDLRAEQTRRIDAEADRNDWKRRATTDELTGHPNRIPVMEALDHYSRVMPGRFAVAFIDIDGLKDTNDTYGHGAGNRLIINAAETISESVRTSEEAEDPALRRPTDLEARMTARLAGDEFALLLPGVDKEEDANLVRERVVRNLQQRGISASMGIHIHAPGETGVEALEAADKEMYEIKRERRRERQEAMRNELDLPVRQRLEETVQELEGPELGGIGVAGLFRLYGDTSR